MSTTGWILIGCTAGFIVAAEVVQFILRRRLRAKESAYERDFGAVKNQGRAGLQNEEGT